MMGKCVVAGGSGGRGAASEANSVSRFREGRELLSKQTPKKPTVCSCPWLQRQEAPSLQHLWEQGPSAAEVRAVG